MAAQPYRIPCGQPRGSEILFDRGKRTRLDMPGTKQMETRVHAKMAALVVGVAAIMLAIMHTTGLMATDDVGLCMGGSWWSRLSHPFIHTGIIHASLNVYVFWQLVFFFPVTKGHLLAAYLMACTCPASVALWTISLLQNTTPTHVVGLSGVVYWLLGWVMPQVSRRKRYCAILLLWMAFGAILGTVAVGIHAYCFIAGSIWRACESQGRK